MSTWTIRINGGAPQTLEQLGVKHCSITRRNMAVSEMRLIVELADVYAAIPIAYGNTIQLLKDSTYWFVGTVTELPASGSKDGEHQEYVVSDVWWKLERIIYQQPYVYRSGDFTKFLGGYSSHIVLGQNAWGAKLATSAVISAIASFAGVAAGASIPTLGNAIYIEARNITCAEAIRRMAAFTPDVVGWVDYSSGVSVLNLAKRSALAAVSLNLNNKDLVELVGAIGPRYDLLINGVVIVFITTAVDSAGKSWVQETRQTAGSTTGEGVIFATVDLNAQGTANPETPPAGLASAYYNCVNTLQWQGSVLLHERECSGYAFPGKVVNLTNGRAGWATMAAVVQTSKEDILNGSTEIELGPAAHLSIDDFIAHMAVFRKLLPSGYSSTNHNGTAGVPVVDGGQGPDPVNPPVANRDSGTSSIPAIFQTVDITVCDSGTDKTARVLGGLL